MEEGKYSKFNAGVALTERLDQLQRAINASRFNPIAMNLEVGTPNYEVWLNANDALLDECWAKLHDKEKKEGKRISKLIRDYIHKCPPLVNTKDGTRINQDNFSKMMSMLDLYTKKIKIYLDEHKLNSPNIDEDEGL